MMPVGVPAFSCKLYEMRGNGSCSRHLRPIFPVILEDSDREIGLSVNSLYKVYNIFVYCHLENFRDSRYNLL